MLQCKDSLHYTRNTACRLAMTKVGFDLAEFEFDVADFL